jgi:hypothetical protein
MELSTKVWSSARHASGTFIRPCDSIVWRRTKPRRVIGPLGMSACSVERNRNLQFYLVSKTNSPPHDSRCHPELDSSHAYPARSHPQSDLGFFPRGLRPVRQISGFRLWGSLVIGFVSGPLALVVAPYWRRSQISPISPDPPHCPWIVSGTGKTLELSPYQGLPCRPNIGSECLGRHSLPGPGLGSWLAVACIPSSIFVQLGSVVATPCWWWSRLPRWITGGRIKQFEIDSNLGMCFWGWKVGMPPHAEGVEPLSHCWIAEEGGVHSGITGRRNKSRCSLNSHERVCGRIFRNKYSVHKANLIFWSPQTQTHLNYILVWRDESGPLLILIRGRRAFLGVWVAGAFGKPLTQSLSLSLV